MLTEDGYMTLPELLELNILSMNITINRRKYGEVYMFLDEQKNIENDTSCSWDRETVWVKSMKSHGPLEFRDFFPVGAK